jgi:hypothetical protein
MAAVNCFGCARSTIFHGSSGANCSKVLVNGDFDVADDGRRIVFDRAREEADIALIEWRTGHG